MSNLKLIKDQIHKNILFSNLESEILSTCIFNRLHHILQNSMAYMVYPNSKTSRFIHSIGTVKVSTDILVNGFRNVESDILQDYLEEIKNYIFSGNLNRNFNEILDDEDDIFSNEKDYKKEISRILKNDILGEHIIKNYTFKIDLFSHDEEIYITYLFILQSLRIASLLHDIGHLPFSHLSEFAIENIFDSFTDKEDKTDVEKYILELIKPFVDNNEQIHEFVGKKLIDLILNRFAKKAKKKDTIEDTIKKFCLVKILSIVKDIFNKKDELYSLYKIISSDLDADRMDYTLRDGYASGLIEKGADIDRITKMFCLTKVKNQNYDSFLFLPAIQSLNDIDEFFLDRAQLYKTLINHHKVKRYDYLLQTAIELAIEEEIKKININKLKEKENEDSIEVNNILDMIIILNKLYHKNRDEGIGSIKKCLVKYSQLTDYWLLSLMKKYFLEQGRNKDSRTEKFFKILDELFTGSKKFKSLWKRNYEFNNIIKIFYSKLEDNEMKRKIYELLFPNEQGNKIYEEYIKNLTLVKHLIDSVYGSSILKYVEKKLSEQYGKVFLVVQSKPAKPVKRYDNMLYKEKLLLIDIKNRNDIKFYYDVSIRASSLEQENDRFMSFYIYYENFDNNIITEDIENKTVELILEYINLIYNKEILN